MWSLSTNGRQKKNGIFEPLAPHISKTRLSGGES